MDTGTIVGVVIGTISIIIAFFGKFRFKHCRSKCCENKYLDCYCGKKNKRRNSSTDSDENPDQNTKDETEV